MMNICTCREVSEFLAYDHPPEKCASSAGPTRKVSRVAVASLRSVGGIRTLPSRRDHHRDRATDKEQLQQCPWKHPHHGLSVQHAAAHIGRHA